jgi:hypothetical protein
MSDTIWEGKFIRIEKIAPSRSGRWGYWPVEFKVSPIENSTYNYKHDEYAAAKHFFGDNPAFKKEHKGRLLKNDKVVWIGILQGLENKFKDDIENYLSEQKEERKNRKEREEKEKYLRKRRNEVRKMITNEAILDYAMTHTDLDPEAKEALDEMLEEIIKSKEEITAA